MFDGAALAKLDIRDGRALYGLGARSAAAFLQPSFNFGQIPDHAAGRKVKALWKFAALLHVVDRCVREWDDFPELVASDCSSYGSVDLGFHLSALHPVMLRIEGDRFQGLEVRNDWSRGLSCLGVYIGKIEWALIYFDQKLIPLGPDSWGRSYGDRQPFLIAFPGAAYGRVLSFQS